MFPNAKIVEEIGRYGGVTGIICLIFAVTIAVLARMKGSPEQKDKRFQVLTGATFVFGVAALASDHYMRAPKVANSAITTTNTTNGTLSPILPNNCGSVTITDRSNTSGQKERK